MREFRRIQCLPPYVSNITESPGMGFGRCSGGPGRLALNDNEERTRQAVRGIEEMLRKDGLL